MSKTTVPEIAEIVSVVGSIAGTIPAIIYNQAALACVPVSLALALNLFNRKNLIARTEQLVQNQQSAIETEIAASRQQTSNLQKEIGQLQLSTTNLSNDGSEMRSQLDKVSSDLPDFIIQYRQECDIQQEAIAKLETAQSSLDAAQSRNSHEILEFQEQLTVSQAINAQLFDFAQQWEKQYRGWEAEKAELVDNMEAQAFDLTYSLKPNPASFYQKGVKHAQKQEWEAAIGEFDKAIEMDSEYAEAYQDRGLAKVELAQKKAAVADLRKAAQCFFDRGDIDSYNRARDLTKNLHEFSTLENSLELEVAEPATVQGLFG